MDGVEIYENDIELYIDQFMLENNIQDMRAVPQSVWNGALMYINRHVFRNKDVLKSNDIYNINNNDIPTNFNSYNYDLVNKVLDYYIYLCQVNNKEVSIIGFSNLTNIDTDTINEWGNDRVKLSSTTTVIYKKLHKMREESLSNKLADGKQNPVGVIAMLNRHYGWASPYTADSNRQKGSLTAAELPKLNGGKVLEITQESP